jgi:hypothetical protein
MILLIPKMGSCLVRIVSPNSSTRNPSTLAQTGRGIQESKPCTALKNILCDQTALTETAMKCKGGNEKRGQNVPQTSTGKGHQEQNTKPLHRDDSTQVVAGQKGEDGSTVLHVLEGLKVGYQLTRSDWPFMSPIHKQTLDECAESHPKDRGPLN